MPASSAPSTIADTVVGTAVNLWTSLFGEAETPSAEVSDTRSSIHYADRGIGASPRYFSFPVDPKHDPQRKLDRGTFFTHAEKSGVFPKKPESLADCRFVQHPSEDSAFRDAMKEVTANDKRAKAARVAELQREMAASKRRDLEMEARDRIAPGAPTITHTTSRQSTSTADAFVQSAPHTVPLPSQFEAKNTAIEDPSMGRQPGSTSAAELKEVHYSRAPGDRYEWICAAVYENAELAVAIYRPTTPPGCDSTTFGTDVSGRTLMRHHGILQDALKLPNYYTYQKHDDSETAKSAANTAARSQGTEAPRAQLLLVDRDLSLLLALEGALTMASEGERGLEPFAYFSSRPEDWRTGN